MDTQAFRSALGKFATGVAIATTVDADGNYYGLTINSFNSVSLNPPLVLFSIDKSARVFQQFSACRAFGISILSTAQENLSNHFAFLQKENFSSVQTYQLQTGVPLIQESLSAFDCELFAAHEGGDHMILIGKVVEFVSQEGNPLLYYNGNYSMIEKST